MEQKYISYTKFHKLDLQMVELTKIIKIFLFLFFLVIIYLKLFLTRERIFQVVGPMKH